MRRTKEFKKNDKVCLFDPFFQIVDPEVLTVVNIYVMPDGEQLAEVWGSGFAITVSSGNLILESEAAAMVGQPEPEEAPLSDAAVLTDTETKDLAKMHEWMDQQAHSATIDSLLGERYQLQVIADSGDVVASHGDELQRKIEDIDRQLAELTKGM